ncbi:MAG: LysM peptidoglycan-binding domain-containing protein [Ardenticatenia bacterium]|nr:LysM peptidoglycan-binding domain-containing protein [Ardenticatenia bacterium]
MRTVLRVLAFILVLIAVSACSRTPLPSPTVSPATPIVSPSPTPTILPSPSPTPTPDYIIHVVQPGETLIRIARQYETTVEAILELNPEITDPNFIREGQEIKVPRR